METEKQKIIEPPKGYIQESPIIEIKQNRSITLTNGGIVKINNNLIYNSNKQSFFDVQIFFSKEKKRYLIYSKFKQIYTMSDISDLKRKTYSGKFKEADIPNILDLDKDEFEPGTATPKNKLKGFFYAKKINQRVWDCPDYIIIG